MMNTELSAKIKCAKMPRKKIYCLVVFTIFFYLFVSVVFHRQKTDFFRSFMDRNFKKAGHIRTYESFTKSSLKNSTPVPDNILQPEVMPVQSLETNEIFTFSKYKKTRPIVFLHIGKSGGRAFDVVMKPVVKRLQGRYIGNKHFDWTFIEHIPNADVVLMLREPVSRAVSHYYFMRTWSNNALNPGPLSNYLRNVNEMLKTRDCWQDGQSAVAWLTGTHIANWVGITEDKVPLHEQMSLNITEMCILAAKRLQSVFWFGLIEDIERSFELMQYQLGLSEKIKFPVLKANKHAKASKNDTRILESLMPQDMWLYEYAKLLFEARWTFYKTGVYKHPVMPPVPSLESAPCISTRAILFCKKGPLSPLYYVSPNTSEEQRKLPSEILNRFNYKNMDFHHGNLKDSYNMRHGNTV